MTKAETPTQKPSPKWITVNNIDLYTSAKEAIIGNEWLNDQHMQFATRAAEIAGTAPAIIYTDFISDIGPIVSGLLEIGIDAVGYHGEMEPSERLEAYTKWRSGTMNIIVATKAFGMGKDKPDIINVIRNSVPETILSWTQELGRAG